MWREWLRRAGLAHEPEIVERRYREEVLGELLALGVEPEVIPNAGATSNGYMIYPYLFHGCFPEIPLAIYRELAVISRIYLSQVVLLDQLFDGDLATRRQPWLAAQWLLQEATRRFQRLLPPESPFWSDHAAIWRSYHAAMALEYRHTGRLIPYPREEFLQTTAGIFSPAKLITSALSTLADRRELLPVLHEAQDLAAAVDQIVDDLDDWRADLRNRRYSFFLTGALERLAMPNPEEVTEEDLAEVIYLQGYYEEFAEYGIQLVEALADRAARLNSSGWVWAVSALRDKLTGRLRAMRRVRQRLGDPGTLRGALINQ
ncbi:MAG: hypothetical protein AB2385_11020 [Symbiobacterium sp.]|uniref:hypothetical protein n=1 Tax=Symbiobacterium sp. TaxID=1971213 RepID=UPI0034644099